MDEPGSFTSLMAMVESHLSKTSLSRSQNGEGQPGPSFSLPNICSVRNSDSDQFLLPPPPTVMQLPRFEVKNSDITEILAHQVKNMLVAKENAANEENEKQRLADELKNMRIKETVDDDYVIDLSASIIRPGTTQLLPKQEVKSSPLSNSSSVESLPSEIEKDTVIKLQKPKQELLPTCQEMCDLLSRKIRMPKVSPFGKVLTARLKPVAAPYFHIVKVTHPDVVPFDFSTPSPCDINKQKRLHPPPDPYAHMNLVERFMATTKDENSS